MDFWPVAPHYSSYHNIHSTSSATVTTSTVVDLSISPQTVECLSYSEYHNHNITIITMASSADRPPTENQISDLPGAKVLITSHNDEGKAIVKETEPVKV